MTKIKHWCAADPKDIETEMKPSEFASILSKYEKFDNSVKDQIYRIYMGTSVEWWTSMMKAISDDNLIKEEIIEFLTLWREQIDANSKTTA